MAAITKAERLDMQTKDAIYQGLDSLNTTRAALESAIKQIDAYRASYQHTDSLLSKAANLQIVISLAAGLQSNMRLDLLAKAESNLSVYHALQHELAQASK